MHILRVVLAQNFIFCGAGFVSKTALDPQQKLKPLLRSSQQQMAMRYFLGIYGSFLWFRSSIRWLSV